MIRFGSIMARNLFLRPLFLATIVAILLLQIVLADRVKHKIYNSVDSSFHCFRRMNRTHQIGCTSSESGNSGILKILRSDHMSEDLDYITGKGSNPPYIVALSSAKLNLDTLLKLKSSNRVSGVIVLDIAGERPSSFSIDRSCPNEQFSLYRNDSEHQFCKTQEWNKPTPDHHDGIQFHDWPFPIFLLRNSSQIDYLLNKSNSNGDWPKLAMELTSPMAAAKDSITCMRRSSMHSELSLTPETFCDPLGGINIYHHTLKKNPEDLSRESVVVLASRLDSFSLFDGISPGADSTLSSLISVLAISELLNRDPIQKMISTSDRALLLALFDGEAFDYIGSSHAAFQLSRGEFPLTDSNSELAKHKLSFSHLSHLIELNQVAHYNLTAAQNYQLYLHKNLHSTSALEELTKLILGELDGLTGIAVKAVEDGRPLPPSSAQSFLKLNKNGNFSALVVTNHEREFLNKYYNSFYEDSENFSRSLASSLEQLSTLFARVVFKLVTGKQLDRNAKANASLIEGLIKCFYQTSSCEYFQYVQEPSLLNRTEMSLDPTFPTYVSVYMENKSKNLRQYTHALLHYLTGEKVSASNSSQCRQLGENDQMYTYLWQNGVSMSGECVKSTVYTVDSISPAFDPESLEIVSEHLDHYSLWTESKWKMSLVRVFVVSSPLQQTITLISGIVLFVVSFIIVYVVNRNFDRFFDTGCPVGDSARITDEEVATEQWIQADTVPDVEFSSNIPANQVIS